MTALSLFLLGGFTVEQNGQPITAFESNKVRALLAYLAVEADRPHQRSVVAGLLWPDHPEEAARTNLRHVLRQLRQSLPDADPAIPLLLTSQQTIQLNPQAVVTVDVVRFGEQVARYQQCNHRTLAECPTCLERCLEAANLYRGDLLTGISLPDSDLFEEWLVVHREALHRQALSLFFTLTDYYEGQAEWEAARRYAWRQLELEPWHEEAHRQLMRVLALSGQRTAALAQFARCRALLAQQLSVEPDAATMALYEQIRDGAFEQPRTAAPVPASVVPQHDWGEAPATAYFFGRQAQVAQLQDWVLGERCRLVVVLGMGGMGKTTLVTKVARAVAEQFDCVIWRSLLNAPPLTELLPGCLRLLAHLAAPLPEQFTEQVALFFAALQQRRALLIFDNFESILAAGEAGRYRPGYEAYGQLLERLAQSDHQSCLVITSRERPRGVGQLEEDFAWVRSLPLDGLEESAGRALLMTRGLSDEADLIKAMVQRYSGNPLALKLVARTIQDLFDGDIAAFLSDEAPIFDDIRTVLDQQFARLTPLEQEILIWLAIERESVTLAELTHALLQPPSRRVLLEALRGLQRRSLLEKTDQGFTLQNVVTEYLTDTLVDAICREIVEATLAAPSALALNRWMLNRHALLKAQAKEYVRQSQLRLLLAPIGKRLLTALGPETLSSRVRWLLDTLRSTAPLAPGYAAGNLLNLLLHLELDLTGYDFSRLAVWQAALRGRTLTAVNFAGADLSGSTVSDTFGVVGAVAYSPDGQWLAAGFSDGELRLWQAASGQPLHRVKAHARPLSALAFSPQSELLVTGGDDFAIHLWETASGRLLRTLPGHTGWVRSVQFSPDGQLLVSASSDQSIRLWDAASGALRHLLYGHEGPVRAVAFHPAGRLIASGGDDCTVRLWDVERGQLLGVWPGHSHAVLAVVFCPDGQTLASSSSDQTIRLWTMAGECYLTLSGHTSDVRCLAFHPDGQMLASGSTDYTVRLWELQPGGQGRLRHTLYGHGSGVTSLAFHPQGETLVSGGDDHTIRLWHVPSGQPRDTMHGYTGWVRVVGFSPDGALLASGSDDGLVRLWDVETGQLRHTLQGHRHWIWSLAFSPRGDLLATGGADHLLCLWNVQSGPAGQILRQHASTVRSLAFSPDGALLASGCADHQVRLWNPESGQLLSTFAGHTGWVQTVAFSPDGALLASGGNDQTVRLWNVHAPGPVEQAVWVLRGHTKTIFTVSFNPVCQDGRATLVASAGEDQMINLWEVHTGALLHRLAGHEREINTLAFHPNGRLLASGSSDQSVRIWDVVTGELVHHLRGHSAWVRTVTFSADGKIIASGSADATIHLWDAETGELRQVLRGHDHWVWSVAFRPQGDLIASGSVDATIKLWEPATGACRFTLRPGAPYAGMNITGVTGITAAQKQSLKSLGAVEQGL